MNYSVISVYSLSTEEKKETLQFTNDYSEWVTLKHKTVFTINYLQGLIYKHSFQFTINNYFFFNEVLFNRIHKIVIQMYRCTTHTKKRKRKENRKSILYRSTGDQLKVRCVRDGSYFIFTDRRSNNCFPVRWKESEQLPKSLPHKNMKFARRQTKTTCLR